MTEQGLDPLPASTGIQATLCRPELLVEIEAIAMFRAEPDVADLLIHTMRKHRNGSSTTT